MQNIAHVMCTARINALVQILKPLKTLDQVLYLFVAGISGHSLGLAYLIVIRISFESVLVLICI